MEDSKFIEVCEKSLSMSKAAAELGLHFNTFKRKALSLGCYNPNQSGKGISKPNIGAQYPLSDILEGKHPQYQTYKLKNRLIKEGIKENKCENTQCNVGDSWNGIPIRNELDHIDGDRTNHKLENLRILCPNCHSQTNTFRAKNIKRPDGGI